jgi:hypothetical protein
MHSFYKRVLQPIGWILDIIGLVGFFLPRESQFGGGTLWRMIVEFLKIPWVPPAAIVLGTIALSLVYGTAYHNWKITHPTETIPGHVRNWFLDDFLPKIIPSMARAKRRRGLKRLLGISGTQAQYFKTTIVHSNVDRRPRFDGWVQHKRAMIAAALGEGEAARFTDDTGLAFHNDAPWPEFKCYIDARIFRIGQLIERVDTLEVDRAFRPEDAQWQQRHWENTR